VTCSLCGRPIEEGQHPYHQVTGWAKGTGKGGGALALKKETGAFAHAHCVEAAKAGRHIDQLTLLPGG